MEELFNWVERRDPLTGEVNRFIDAGVDLMNNAANTALLVDQPNVTGSPN